MARRKRKQKVAAPSVVAGLPVIRRPDDVLEPVYEADPDGRPVVHHRTVDTLGIMLRAGTITQAMHDAARDFQAQFTIARFDAIRCTSLVRLPGGAGRAGGVVWVWAGVISTARGKSGRQRPLATNF
jgi:hypothetical protein